jgi:AhpD family alkylhydroperoxidase
MDLLVEPPTRPAWYLRPMLWLVRRITGRDPLPARLLAHSPRLAIGCGVFEALAPAAPGQLDARSLAAARIAASATAGCPFCLDMNAATFKRAGLGRGELEALLSGDEQRWTALGRREELAARYARALSRTPIAVPEPLRAGLREAFSERERVALASAIAQVNYWSRFNQGLGVPAAGFFDEPGCELPRGG